MPTFFGVLLTGAGVDSGAGLADAGALILDKQFFISSRL